MQAKNRIFGCEQILREQQYIWQLAPVEGGVYSCVRAQDADLDMQDIMEKGCLVEVKLDVGYGADARGHCEHVTAAHLKAVARSPQLQTLVHARHAISCWVSS